MPDVICTVPLKAVRPDLSPNLAGFKSVLEKLSRTDALFHIARLNTVISKATLSSSALDHQRRALRILDLTPRTKERISAFAREKGGVKNVAVICRGALLESYRWIAAICVDHPDDGTTFQDVERREALFAAILYATEIWHRRTLEGIRRAAKPGPNRDAFRLAFLRRQFLENTTTLSLAVAFGRAWDLFKERMSEALPVFPEWFEAANGITLDQHWAITAITNQIAQEGVESMPDGERGSIGVLPTRTLGNDTLIGTAVQTYLKHRCIPIEELQEAFWEGEEITDATFDSPPRYPSSHLRRRPIIVAADGRGIVADPVYFRELVLAGVLFNLPQKQRGTALAAFGEAFESYGHRLLQRVYPSSSILAEPLALNMNIEKGGQRIGEIDAAVVQNTDAIFFELKSAWLRDDTLETGSEADFLKNLEDRYASDDHGTGQLARTVVGLSELSHSRWPDPIRAVRTVFPVLVTYDNRMDYSFQEFFLRRFRDQLGIGDVAWRPFPELGNGSGLRVAPLTVLSIDDLEFLEEVVTRGARMIDVVRDYASMDVSTRGTFDEFLLGSRYRDLRRWNQYLVAAGMEGLDWATKLLYGRGIDEA